MTFISAQIRVRDWLFHHALPLWAEQGQGPHGRSHERLDFSGKAVTGMPRRTRVQARQVYVFAQGAVLGWTPGIDVAQNALDALIRDNRRDDGLWVRSTDEQGAVLDTTPDLYDLAFVMFALSAGHHVLKDPRALPLALETMAAIQFALGDPRHGGWLEALPPELPRRQNPHMHMLEALISWQETAPQPSFEAAARQVIDLFATRFFDPDAKALGEYFNADWQVAEGLPGRVTEPGHHMEWVWLLNSAARVGLPDLSAQTDALFASAMQNGFDTHGFVLRELDRQAQPLDGGRRLWCQTETVRTLVLRGHTDQALKLLDQIFETHLATDVPGLWVDAYDAEGVSHDTSVPASTFYHLMTAFSALLSVPK